MGDSERAEVGVEVEMADRRAVDEAPLRVASTGSDEVVGQWEEGAGDGKREVDARPRATAPALSSGPGGAEGASGDASSDSVVVSSTSAGEDGGGGTAAQAAPRNRMCNVLTGASCGASCCAPGSRPYDFMLKWHLPLGLVLFVIFGAAYPVPGAAVSEAAPILSTIMVMYIFLTSGLKLKYREVRRALASPWAAGYGVVSILGVSPCLGFLAARIPLENTALALGLAVFLAMPTTISTSILYTTQAKGNQALALFFSVSTNLLGSVTAPLFVSAFLAEQGSSGADTVGLLVSLLQSVMAPVVVGLLIQTFVPHARSVIRDEGDFLKVSSSLMLILIPWLKVSSSRDTLLTISWGDLGAVIGLAIGFHLVLLVFNALGVSLLPHTDTPERKSTLIATSQKTLAIAVAVIESIEAAGGTDQGGILVVVCILSHFIQSIIDAFFAARLSSIHVWPWTPCATPQETELETELEAEDTSPDTAPKDGVPLAAEGP